MLGKNKRLSHYESTQLNSCTLEKHAITFTASTSTAKASRLHCFNMTVIFC